MILLSHRQIPVFHAGGKYDQSFCAAELLKLVDKVIQLYSGAEAYLDEHGIIAGDDPAFFKMLDPCGDSGRGKKNLFCNVFHRDSGIF